MNDSIISSSKEGTGKPYRRIIVVRFNWINCIKWNVPMVRFEVYTACKKTNAMNNRSWSILMDDLNKYKN